MPLRTELVCVLLTLALMGQAHAADGIKLAPNRALYTTSLSGAKTDSDVVGASGTMAMEMSETCDAWTVTEHDKLTINYGERGDVEMNTTFASWESKDGLRFRFSEKETKNGEVDEEVSGEARLDGAGKGGTVEFTKPKGQTLTLAAGVLFPTTHTLRLITRAGAGDPFVAAKVLDGTAAENAADVSAVIGAPMNAADTAADAPTKSPLLRRPSWHVHLAFFPADSSVDHPDYELGMRLLDNGIARDMLLDYGDFAIKAKLEKLEPLPAPKC